MNVNIEMILSMMNAMNYTNWTELKQQIEEQNEYWIEIKMKNKKLK